MIDATVRAWHKCYSTCPHWCSSSYPATRLGGLETPGCGCDTWCGTRCDACAPRASPNRSGAEDFLIAENDALLVLVLIVVSAVYICAYRVCWRPNLVAAA